MSKRNKNLPGNRKQFLESQKTATGYSGHQKFSLNPRKTEFPITMSDWFGTLLLLMLPFINLLCLLKWSFGAGVKSSKRNFARAYLLIMLIALNMVALLFLILYFLFDINVINQIRVLFV